ncbi:hypothetical protein HY967_01610 [Candidatus Jorgensenbacteria bacterium]|nr:hypothetical protein [Candidatus Jorgensenbacteria bacterium]
MLKEGLFDPNVIRQRGPTTYEPQAKNVFYSQGKAPSTNRLYSNQTTTAVKSSAIGKIVAPAEKVSKRSVSTALDKIGVKSENIVSVRQFGSSVEGKVKPNDYDHFIIVKDGSMKFSKRDGMNQPIIKTVGKDQYFIMPETDGEDLLQAMLYTGRKDQDRLYSGKTVDLTKEFKKKSNFGKSKDSYLHKWGPNSTAKRVIRNIINR